jgi:TonB family protein
VDPPSLPGWPGTEILRPSVLEIAVDSDGGVVTAWLVPPGSGAAAADQEALRIARGLRFAPAPAGEGASPWQWDTIEFVWQTELTPRPP